jgi:hypothetical protein
MTRNTIFRFFIGFLLLSGHDFIAGQNSDFGIWYSVNGEHKLTKKLDLLLASEVRTFSNASQLDQIFGEGGVSYTLNDFFSTAGSYRLTGKLEDDGNFHIRHKWFGEAKLTFPVNRFNFSARLMLQIMKRTYIEKEDDNLPQYTGRFKLKAEYDIQGLPLTPFISFESFTPMFYDYKLLIDKERFSAGAAYKVSKKILLKPAYILERYPQNKNEFNYHVLALSCELKF